MRIKAVLICICLYAAFGLVWPVAPASAASGKEYHVSVQGDDAQDGSASRPLRTISAAARLAQPGDVITVHEGVYRERIDPPRGGASDEKRIVYRAAPGEEAVIKGSEVVKGWEKAQNDAWKVTVPNSLFGDFNPYSDLIAGDWFGPKGREHHTGAVYLNGHWLIEAVDLDDVLKPIGQAASSYVPGGQGTLLNVAWLRPGTSAGDDGRVAADAFAAQHGVQTAPCSEGGKCVGWIEQGDWIQYEDVDFGRRSGQIEIRAASATAGGIIEVRLDGPKGELLGSCKVPNTGGWQSWSSFQVKTRPLSGVKTICLTFKGFDAEDNPDLRLWYAKVDASNTTIWAQFKNVNPNEAEVEINVRQAVFYPEKEGINYLTVRGFKMMHAATPWAPPTAEQVGLIGTHWSKGWIIEDCDISYSVCVGITLGKHGDEYDNTSANTAEGYVETIHRALARGWSKENIGHHIVRNNHISHCEQAGIVGSMGPVFCVVTNNVIHDIHIRQLFTGAEMAGIKFHGAIDTVISQNHIHRTCLGIWLDWMTQGTRVSRNLLHDNGRDLFVEVNHGPFMVDNNLLLSPGSILVNSQGGAYVHNLVAGDVPVAHNEGRQTPHQKPHSTEVVGLAPNPSGDDKYFNNLFLKRGLTSYDPAKMPVFMGGNVFVAGAEPSKHEADPLVQTDVDPDLKLSARNDRVYLEMTVDPVWAQAERQLVTTQTLGVAKITDLPYEQADGTPYRFDTDYFGKKRNTADPCPGPFALPEGGRYRLKVWPPAELD